MVLWEVLPLRRYERQFLVFWVGQVRGFRLEKHLTQEKLAEALYLSARSYQKLEQGVHLPCATTLALFLASLPTRRPWPSSEPSPSWWRRPAPKRHLTRLRPHPASPKKSPTPGGHDAGEESALVNCPCYALPPTSSPTPLDNQDGFL